MSPALPRPWRWLLLASLLSSAAGAAPRVHVAYPPQGHRVAYDHVILEGSVTPGASLKVGGQSVPVGADGLYTLWWPLKPGNNALRLVATLRGQSGSTLLNVTRTVSRPLPATPTAIRPGSAEPRESLEFWDPAGDTPAERSVSLHFEGSPGGRASFRIAGGAAQPLREGPAGHYSGQYLLPTTARLSQAAVTLSLTGRDGRTVSVSAPGRLSTGSGPATATQNPGTVRGLGVNEASFVLTTLSGEPLLYPLEGTSFLAVGRQGEDLRVRLAPGLSALVRAEQVSLRRGLPPAPVPGPLTLDLAAAASVTSVAAVPALPASPAAAASSGGTSALSTTPALPPGEDLRLRLPLGGARPPFTLRQSEGGRRIEWTLYGLASLPASNVAGDPYLTALQAEQPAPGTARLSLSLAAPAWGFHAAYEGTDLVLTVRRPPPLDPVRPLLGRVIVLDPGHGGSNLGGAGLFAIPEKGLTLPVALRAARWLREWGADVSLTRERDVFVGLTERALQAEASRADLLVSLHYNALPDGRDPRGVRGPEVYYTHPQAEALAGHLLTRLRSGLPELGPGAGLKPGANLALTRPSTQITLLLEMAYLTDAGNVRVMHSEAGQEKLARAIAEGVRDFYAAQSPQAAR